MSKTFLRLFANTKCASFNRNIHLKPKIYKFTALRHGVLTLLMSFTIPFMLQGNNYWRFIIKIVSGKEKDDEDDNDDEAGKFRISIFGQFFLPKLCSERFTRLTRIQGKSFCISTVWECKKFDFFFTASRGGVSPPPMILWLPTTQGAFIFVQNHHS